MEVDKHCTIYIASGRSESPSVQELQKQIERSDDKSKADALKELILSMIHGEPYSRLLMTVIRFAVPSSDTTVKRLLQIYFEIVDKCKPDGSLKEEMILVCNALRNDLIDPNEYVRGTTLRLLCKMKYYKILEPLIEVIVQNLTHRHSYVRRNAVNCVYSIVKNFGSEIVPNASEEIEKLLLVEGDSSTKRNAFLMLVQCDPDRAFNYIVSIQEVVGSMGDIFQLVILDLFRILAKQNFQQKGVLLRIIVNMMAAAPPCVAYESAGVVMQTCGGSSAIRGAVEAYINLLVKQADINVKLIILDRLQSFTQKYHDILQHYVMDILRALNTASLDVRRKTIEIALQVVTHRTILNVMSTCKKEIIRTIDPQQTSVTGNVEYRRLLIRTVHTSCSRFPSVAHTIMNLLLDFLCEQDIHTSTEVAVFLREFIATQSSLSITGGDPLTAQAQQFSKLKNTLLVRIIDTLKDIPQSRVIRICLWIIGAYCDDPTVVQTAQNLLWTLLSPFPLTVAETQSSVVPTLVLESQLPQPRVKVSTRTVILDDGTYGTEDVYEDVDDANGGSSASKNELTSHIRCLVIGGDMMLCSMIAVTVVKLASWHAIDETKYPLPTGMKNRMTFLVACLLKLVRTHPSGGPPCDAAVRIQQSLSCILSIQRGDKRKNHLNAQTFNFHSRDALKQVLEIELSNQEASFHMSTEEFEKEAVQVDELLSFRQLRDRRVNSDGGIDLLNSDMKAAVGCGECGFSIDESDLFLRRLAKVQQMTGLVDPVYVEAFLRVHQFDLIVELLVINRTKITLQNVNVELSTHGDLKLFERPQAVTLTAGESATVYASIKVNSTETGIIFGYVTYDKRGGSDKEWLALNELHTDLLDYIHRSWVGELAFRTMWSEFEWENKININTAIADVGLFLRHIMRHTNMTIVGKYAQHIVAEKAGHTDVNPTSSASGSSTKIPDSDPYLDSVEQLATLKNLTTNSSFVAVNLYSKSIFGEDALANVSIEKTVDGKLAGSVRIRSRKQGIALSLGDRITIIQRGLKQ